MTPDLWQRVKDVYAEASRKHRADVPAFLDAACAGHDDLRAEVESLLEEESRTDTFLNDPVMRLDQSFIGTEMLHYKIIEKLGEGGMGMVYKARDSRLDRFVALKLLTPKSMADPENSALARARFLEEARMSGSLSHTNIANVFDVGEWSGTIYMVQELASGRDLKKIIAESGFLPLRRATAIIRQICDGLAHAHSRGIVHRDIKPANIVVDSEDRVKITDFGIAQRRAEKDITQEPLVAGTPGYMAPEQLLGREVDARADQFSVGCLAYEMFTGRQAFPGETMASVIDKTLHSFPPDPSRIRDHLPRTLDRLVARSMRKDPGERYDNISLLAQDLLNYEQFEYLTDQHRAAKEIADALAARECLLVLGLHLPISVGEKGSHTSDRLVADQLSEHLGVRLPQQSLARIAQDLEMERGRAEMVRHLSAAVRNPAVSPREVLRRIAPLPFPVIVTTRYDTFLEDELARAGRKVRSVLDCRKEAEDLSGGDLLIRLLGGVEKEESIVVTEDDLWEFLGNFHSLSDSLKALFAQRTILFIGYDPEDEGFRHLVLEILRFRAGTTGGCYLTVSDVSLPVVRWSQSKKLHLVETQPAEFLLLLEEALVEKRRQQVGPEQKPDQRVLPSRPYKFLNYYESGDEVIFFGRRAETGRLASKIHAYPLNVLYAPSGSGKTSLINAGLSPLLRREGYVPIYARVYDDPIGEIRRASLEACGDNASDLGELPLEELLPQLARRGGKNLVIFVDQFEEIFIRYDRVARDHFVEVLDTTLTQAKGQVRFVLSLREDFLARLSEFRDKLPTIFHNEFRLDPLTKEAAREAIIEPAKLLGLGVEPALADRLIADLVREGIEPPQLQIVCDTLFDKLGTGENQLTLKNYLALGETRKILGNYMERVLREMPPEQREPARTILKCLVTSENTKSVSRIADLVRQVGRPDEEITRILLDLSNRRLIRRVQHDEGFWFELTHEYLVDEIVRWVSAQEKELKKVRELLEQAVRNYRNLGILMRMAQIRLIQAHEDDLHLSKEERQLLRESEMAVRGKRKAAAIACCAAALLLLVCGVTGRYMYLRSHIFIQPQDRELIQYNDGAKQAFRMEGLRVYSGSPSRLWLDARLGFPKILYNADVELDELDADHRDAVKAGAIFPRTASFEDEIFKMLPPDRQVRFLITNGRREEALKLLPGLFRNPSVDGPSIDRLVAFLGYSGIAEGSIVPDAVRHAFREVTSYTYPDERNGVAVLLMNVPEAGWRPQLVAPLENLLSRERALTVLGLAGTREDVPLIVPYVQDAVKGGFMTDVDAGSSAIAALSTLGDCSALPRIRQVVFESGANSSQGQIIEGLKYICACGDESDLARIEGKLAQEVDKLNGGDPSTSWHLQGILQSLYGGYGRRAIPALQHTFARWPARDEFRVGWIGTFLQPELLPLLQSSLSSSQPAGARAGAAGLISSLGETAGLSPAAEIAQDPRQKAGDRRTALSALDYYRGPAIRSILMRLLKTTKADQLEVRGGVYGALRWDDDDETLAALLAGLNDRDDSVRMAALESFASDGSVRKARWLKNLLSSLSPETKVYAARALQHVEPDTDGGIFSAYLREQADTSKDYAALVMAIIGLRDSYLTRPVPDAVDALLDPHREIRLAATLALTQHPKQDEVTKLLQQAVDGVSEPQHQLAVRRAQWAVGVCSRMRGVAGAAHDALSKGDWRGASNRMKRFDAYDAFDYKETLKVALLATKRSAQSQFRPRIPYLFEDAISDPEPIVLLLAEIDLKGGLLGSALESIERVLVSRPTLRKSIAADPRFQALRNNYRFRVMTGLEPPKVINEIPPPENPALPSKPTAKK